MSTQRSFGNKEMSYYMLVIITYDVNTENEKGRKRLRNVAKYCVAHGQRVQNSVFECILDASQYIKVKYDLVNLIKFEVDSIVEKLKEMEKIFTKVEPLIFGVWTKIENYYH